MIPPNQTISTSKSSPQCVNAWWTCWAIWIYVCACLWKCLAKCLCSASGWMCSNCAISDWSSMYRRRAKYLYLIILTKTDFVKKKGTFLLLCKCSKRALFCNPWSFGISKGRTNMWGFLSWMSNPSDKLEKALNFPTKQASFIAKIVYASAYSLRSWLLYSASWLIRDRFWEHYF